MGETAEGPSGHIVVCLGGQLIPGLILSQISRSSSKSWLLPLPSIILCRIFSNQLVPSRQGAHFPHDSLAKNLTTLWQALTMSVVLSITTIAPEPNIEPAWSTAVFSKGRSRCSSKNHGAEAPPGMNALISLPFLIPFPYFSPMIRSRKVVVPNSTS